LDNHRNVVSMLTILAGEGMTPALWAGGRVKITYYRAPECCSLRLIFCKAKVLG
jgi:hypothetical protein